MDKLGDEEADSHIPRLDNYRDSEKRVLIIKMDGHMRTAKNSDSGIMFKGCKWGFESCTAAMFIGYTICYFAYVAFGAFLFMMIEGDEDEVELATKIQTVKTNVLQKFPDVKDEVFDKLLSEMSSAGISGLQALNATEPKWTYGQAVFFCVTLLTTIGYGHVAPVSQVGKAICMIYTAFGIPFTLMLLAAYVQRAVIVAQMVQKALTACLGEVLKPMSIRILFMAMATTSVGFAFFFMPALVFRHLETEWTYLDALYFCFISLTTVGLGDFVPGKSNTNVQYKGLYRFGVSCYLLVGVSALMFLMALLTQIQHCVIRRRSRVKKAPFMSTRAKYGSIQPDKALLICEKIRSDIKRGYQESFQ